MYKKLFLTSAIILGFMGTAVAVPANTDEFPQDGLMQEDYTYTNAATYENMGVYSGGVRAAAEYETILYQLAAGQYLPAGGETPIDCDQAGYFCPGVAGTVTYDADNPQGLTSCSTETGGVYTLSDGSGDSADSCYRLCSGNVTIAHSTGVTGNDYYGNGADTCEPTGCVDGYHKTDPVPNLAALIGSDEAGTDYGYRSNSGTGSNYHESKYGITNDGEFVVSYGEKGIVTGYAQCTSQQGSWPWANSTYNIISGNTLDALPDNVGTHCWCKLDGYIPDGQQKLSFTAPWVYNDSGGDGCLDHCASSCAGRLQMGDSNWLAFRAAVFDTVTPSLSICAGNTIEITWESASVADVNVNNAGVCTYGEDVRTPHAAEAIPGKRFVGWRFEPLGD